MSIYSNINTPMTNNFQTTTGSAQMKPKITPQEAIMGALKIFGML